MLADAAQGGIPLGITALEMTRIERRAAMAIIRDIREKQEEEIKKRRKRKGVKE